MAAMDKLYGSITQYHELREWLKKNKKAYLKYMYSLENQEINEECTIGNFGGKPMKWLSENCPLNWVKEQALDKIDMFERFFGRKY